MLRNAICCERQKCRGTLIWPAFFLIPVIPTLLGAGNYLGNLEILSAQWYSLWTQVTLFYATFFFAPLIGAYCAFLWRYENFNNNRNALFSLPISYETIYLAKLFLAFGLTSLTQLWFAVLFFFAGKAVGFPGALPPQLILWILRGLPGAFVICSIQLLLASFCRSFALPVALGAIGGVTGLLAANSKAGIFWPWAQMLLGMNSNKNEDFLAGSQPLFFFLCILYLFLFVMAGILFLKKKGS